MLIQRARIFVMQYNSYEMVKEWKGVSILITCYNLSSRKGLSLLFSFYRYRHKLSDFALKESWFACSTVEARIQGGVEIQQEMLCRDKGRAVNGYGPIWRRRPSYEYGGREKGETATSS